MQLMQCMHFHAQTTFSPIVYCAVRVCVCVVSLVDKASAPGHLSPALQACLYVIGWHFFRSLLVVSRLSNWAMAVQVLVEE